MQECKLLQLNVYNKVYKTISNKLAEKGLRASVHKDSQDGTVEDAPSAEQYVQFVMHMMQEGVHDSNALRDLSIFLFMTMSVGRYFSWFTPIAVKLIADVCPIIQLGFSSWVVSIPVQVR